MRFSILHISDLHRDLRDEVDNPPLIESLNRDFERYRQQDPAILRPTLCIVSGDLVYGVSPNADDATNELARQYAQAWEFLAELADRFFEGKRERIVVLPGNHDISYPDVLESAQRIDIPSDPHKRTELVSDLFAPKSRLRWSWSEMCFYRIVDDARYDDRLRHYAMAYERFYQGQRAFPLAPEQQYGVFDFPDLAFCVVALNSCYNNDPLRRRGAFHPTALSEACRALRETKRAGWLIAAAWHHNIAGGPTQDDYLDVQFLQLLIDAGASLGFHGHQHTPDCVDERYRLGPSQRKMTIVSTGTLCTGPCKLKPGVPRGYNIVEVDTEAWSARVHLRHMANFLFDLPVWGPGHFNITNKSYVDFDLCKPLLTRPAQLDAQLALDRGDKLLGTRQWREAADVLGTVKEAPLARPLLVRALSELGDTRRMIDTLWPPQTGAEAVTVGGAILDGGTHEDAEAFMQLEFVSGSSDASIREIARRIRQRWAK